MTATSKRATTPTITYISRDDEGGAQIWSVDGAGANTLWVCYRFGPTVPMHRVGTDDWFHTRHNDHGVWQCDCGKQGTCIHRALAARVAEGLPDEAEVLPGGERISQAPASMEVRSDLSRSMRAWPVIRPLIEEHLGARVYRIEGTGDHNLLALIDRHCGVDALAFREGLPTLPLALRMQFRERHDNFSIRGSRASGAECELEKWQRALKCDGAFRPALMVQAFLTPDGTTLRSLGVASVQDILAEIDAGRCRRVHCGDVGFLTVSWQSMRAYHPVWVHAANRDSLEGEGQI